MSWWWLARLQTGTSKLLISFSSSDPCPLGLCVVWRGTMDGMAWMMAATYKYLNLIMY